MKFEKIILTIILIISGFGIFAQNKTFTTNLPIIYLNTGGDNIVDDPKIIVQMEIAWKGEGESNKTSDPRTHFKGDINIEIRGSSSQMFPKKSYGFELKDEEGLDMDFPLLGMPEEEDWILYAPYSDKTLIRNVLALTLAAQIDTFYTPRCRFVELFVNNKYEGVYVLMEKIKRDKNRVDIAKLKPEDIEGDELTGGYIIKIDKSTGSGGGGWRSIFNNSNGSNTYYQYHYPKAEKIQQPQKEYIQNFISEFESAVYYHEFDPENGYQSFINHKSFFNYIFINEITKNVDGYRLSTFLYKDKNEKLNAGPVWDFNLGFGNANYYNGWEPYGFQIKPNLEDDNWQNPFWWVRLTEDSYFTNPLKCRWDTLRENQLSDGRVFAITDSLVNLLTDASIRNFERWKIINEWVWPNYYVGNSYWKEVNWMKDWLATRLQWLDLGMPGNCGEIPDPTQPTEFSFDIFPNPFNTKLKLQIQAETFLTYKLQLFTVNGQMVKNINLYVFEGSNSFEINTSNLQNGMFIYRLIRGDSEVSVGKIIKI